MTPLIRRALMVISNKFGEPYNVVENRFNDLVAIREPRVDCRNGPVYALALQDLYNEWVTKTNGEPLDIHFGKAREGR